MSTSAMPFSDSKVKSLIDKPCCPALTNIAAGRQHKLIALTNNFAKVNIPAEELEFLGWGDGGATPNHLRELFDDFCDSSTLGMR
jgi:hypothetical protein